MGLMIGIWIIAFIAFGLAIWTSHILKKQDERLKQLKIANFQNTAHFVPYFFVLVANIRLLSSVYCNISTQQH
ncbi:hypothetical protein INT82_11920 [Mannheimia haemolytica]|nr:hypothetical protein [Mannheimia haemolytica]